LFPWRAVVLPWLVSRLLCAAVIVAATSWPFDRIEFRGFQIWDGVWYTAIARDGYGVLPVDGLQTRWPFFPLLPGIMRGFGELGLGDQAARTEDACGGLFAVGVSPERSATSW
jgi:hypothetical protein